MCVDPVDVRLRDPPLAGDAFVNQRLAVGGKGGDLGFNAIHDLSNVIELIHEIFADRALLLN